jgi:glycosyltransferase involved in cell wall biosynthesis
MDGLGSAMRIGVNCFLLRPHAGGLKQYFLGLFEELLTSDTKNKYVFFYFEHNLDELAKLRNDSWRKNGILLRDQLEVKQHLGKIDLYFSPFGPAWPRPVPIPSVTMLADVQEVFFPEFFTPMDMFNRDYHFRGSTRMADRVITISHYSKKTMVERYGIKDSRIVVCHLSADARYYRAAEAGTPPSYPLPAQGYVMYPANRWLHKNHDVLLRAIERLKAKGVRIDAVFTGYDAPGGYPLLQKAAEYGIGSQVHSLQYVTVEEMAYLYSKARMLVFPSLFEGFGIPLVEAMAAGCPVACSRATSLPEIGLNAVEYFDPKSVESVADAVERVWIDGSRRRELAELGRARAGDFSAGAAAVKHVAAFEEAARSFRNKRYWWQEFCYQHIHRNLVFFKHRKALRGQEHAESPDGLSVIFSAGWHQREADGADWLRWTTGIGKLTVKAARDGTLELAGEIASLQRPNDVEVRLNGQTVASWHLAGEFGFKAFEPLSLGVGPGQSTIELVSANPGIAAPPDSRVLAIAVRNLVVKLSAPRGQAIERATA